MQHAQTIKFLSGLAIETVVNQKKYMAKGGGLWDQKWCEFKLLSTTSHSHAYKTSHPRAARGRPLGIKPCPDSEGSINKRED
jgi:hypothetical protein